MLPRPQHQVKTRPDKSWRRTLVVTGFIVVWMLIIGGRLVQLQVSERDELTELAHRQQERKTSTAPERGQLIDRAGRSLARSAPTESIFVAPEEMGDIESTAEHLANALGLDKANLVKRLSEGKSSASRSVSIARQLEPDKAKSVLALNIRGVHATEESKRYYPKGSLAAHVLGFVSTGNVGLAGIEQFYNQRIVGDPGKVFLEKDSRGRSYESFEVNAKPGQDIVLTLDEVVQARVERALAEAVTQSHAKSGRAIVLDPYNGEILALANVPTFDPNSPGAATLESTRNRVLQSYEPGSTFKIVTYSAAIEKGLAKPDEQINCLMGQITIGTTTIHDHHPFGVLTVADALAKSSNVGAILLAQRLKAGTLYDYIQRFGFGARTGVELTGESRGMLAPVSAWNPASIGYIAMGQQVGVTPLQMAAAFGAVANSGVWIAPHLVREIREPGGAVIQRSNPAQHRVISAETAAKIKEMLQGVTTAGTATKAQLDGYSSAGKTGTAQMIDPETKKYTKYIASFAGFAPVDHPAFVIVIVIDEPAGSHHGGDVAAPVFREIAEHILPDLGIAPGTQLKPSQPNSGELIAQATEAPAQPVPVAAEPSNTSSAAATQDSRDGEIVYTLATRNAVLMPDLRGRSVRDAARTCQQLGLRWEAHGDGRVLRQSPAPGAEVAGKQVIQVFGAGE